MLYKNRLTPLAGNAIRPRGWLLRQLQIQAAGLSGHLDTVWPDVAASRWIGGDQEGWERVPYWLDGLIPLAYLLEDADMQSRARRYVDAILSAQEADGWICPCTREERQRYDMWALFLIAKVLTVYADLSGDDRVEPALYRALAQYDRHIDGATVLNWGAARWYECLIPIFWLYERRPEAWLLKLARKLRAQGVDYEALFDPYQDQTPERRWTYLTHVVNLAMGLKQQTLTARLSGGGMDAFAEKALETLLRHHGMAVGHFTGDECVAGDSPVRGTELCGVVEAMYSYETLLAAGGNPIWGDRLERLAFNALPAAISPDMWTHQYDQMTNQVQCAPLEEGHVVFGTNGPESHVFGLEPNFGCCTANFNQGWPKFALSTFMRTENALYSTALAPAQATVEIGGARVVCTLDTEYPFRDTLEYTIETNRPARFTLGIRIPGFAAGAMVDGQAAEPGTFHTLERTWEGRTTVRVSLAFEARLMERPRDMRCLWRGPLLYALPIRERWERVEYERNGVLRRFPYCDYAIYPESPWNYAFAGEDFTLVEEEMGEYPFSPEGSAISIEALLAPIDWDMDCGVCAEEPRGRVPIGASRRLRMIPYGCTNLRMAEMPRVEGEPKPYV